MVNENLKAIVENKKPVEEVREIENEIPSFEEFMKTYENDGNLNYADLNGGSVGEVKGYGPCKKDSCNCSCSWDGCGCRWSKEMWIHEDGECRFGVIKNSVEAKIGLDSTKLEVKNSLSLIRKKEGRGGESRWLTRTTSGTVSLNEDGFGAKAEAGVDLWNYEDGDGSVRIGPNVDTGGSITDNGIEAKFLGFGFSVGKETGVSLPIGELKFKTDDCVVQ